MLISALALCLKALTLASGLYGLCLGIEVPDLGLGFDS